ncbi:MAG: L-rhamnose mutarotase [Candidatus Hydrogenedentes bacterium]|nr:L-rhamnose mutarotase [Candidatus Hydrogenedentota bacterium]
MQRFGAVTQVREDKAEQYKALHRAVWPDVLQQIANSNIYNYSIFLRRLPDGNLYLFSYFEYAGEDFDADMKAMAADPTTQEWWDVCVPCLKPLPDRAPGEVWASMEEVFHAD